MVFSAFTMLGNYHIYWVPNTSSSQKKTLDSKPTLHMPPLQHPWAITSLRIYICWTFHVNKIMKYVIFLCLASLISMMFWRFITLLHVSVFHSFVWLNTTPLYIWFTARFVYTFIRWWIVLLCPSFGCWQQSWHRPYLRKNLHLMFISKLSV